MVKNLSKYVFETSTKNKKILYDTVSQKILPLESDHKTLQENNFLSGQEKDSLYSRLFRMPEALQLYLIPTWGCNLRCPFCYVLDKLEGTGKEDNAIDFDGFYNFVEQYIDKYHPKVISFAFLGGEPLSNIKNCISFMEKIEQIEGKFKIKCRKAMTTNFTVKIEKKHLKFLRSLDQVSISVDGLREDHNELRKVYKDKLLTDPFITTLKNISNLPLKIKQKIKIQTAAQDKFFENQNIKEFFLIFKTIGINKEQISTGVLASTKYFKAGQKNLDYLRGSSVFNAPCCIFRYMSFFVIDSNGIHTNYFDNDKQEKMCNFQEQYDFSLIEKLYKKHIIENMPILRDSKCMKCPVVGLCWGKCFGSSCSQNPSNYCGQEKLIERVSSLAENKELV